MLVDVTVPTMVGAGSGLLLSLFIRPRRVWVRARRNEGADDDGPTTVEVAGLDRSTAGDVQAEVAEVTDRLRQLSGPKPAEEEHR